jgi:XTP/dITP diphosphohydrolase
MRKVVLASRNRHKVIEIAELCRGLDFDLRGIDELAPGTDLVEDEPTFEGNALAKARQAAAATGLPALADDSGLEVDALMGAPGVRSARYAGEPSDDRRNNEKLLAALNEVAGASSSTPSQRSARYRCVAAYVDLHSGLQLMGAGACEGEILTKPRGEGGFGYDPLFLLPGLGRTMAEIDLATKNGLSHRAAAFRALIAQLAARG